MLNGPGLDPFCGPWVFQDLTSIGETKFKGKNPIPQGSQFQTHALQHYASILSTELNTPFNNNI